MTAAMPSHTGFTPIASCQWQSLAAILAARGMPDADRSLCPTWGFRWDSGGVLSGAGRWPQLVHELFGVRIEQHVFATPDDCEHYELALGRAGLPFVAEIDAFYVPSPYQATAHVVHTVVVNERTTDGAVIVDTTNHPMPREVPIEEYRVLRESPCDGRIESYKLYLPLPGPLRRPTGPEILARVRHDLDIEGPTDLEVLDKFLDWYAGSPGRISVSRVAAERFAAARLFELLAEGGSVEGAALAGELRGLADDWYMVHMLADHSRADEPRLRRRILRLMRQLASAEQRMLVRLRGDEPCRVPLLDIADAFPRAREVYRMEQDNLGRVRNLTRVTASSVAAWQTTTRALQIYSALRTLDRRLVDLLCLYTSLLNGCNYCIDDAAGEALASGWRPAQLLALGRLSDQAHPAETMAALRYAAVVARDPQAVDDSLVAELRRHYDNEALLELTAVLGMKNFWNRFATALRIPPENKCGDVALRTQLFALGREMRQRSYGVGRRDA